MIDSILSPKSARAVKEAHEILARMRSATVGCVRAEEQSRKAIRESRHLLGICSDGDPNY